MNDPWFTGYSLFDLAVVTVGPAVTIALLGYIAVLLLRMARGG